MGRAREGRYAIVALLGEWLGGRASGLGGVSLGWGHKDAAGMTWVARVWRRLEWMRER
jgi:hypothetical protein